VAAEKEIGRGAIIADLLPPALRMLLSPMLDAVSALLVVPSGGRAAGD